ncbi:MAG: GIY-YIG nuclease family protein [Phycisphaeraceae bacterium]|nr:GIY-YIG nuclease family protein [Phycisphaerales bacterium]MCB9860982.1 GIY-YIG nuclease family protein [Phycisphaeraceae bacterium]
MASSKTHTEEPHPLLLFDLLQSLDATIIPEDCKVHLARSTGIDDPLNVYFAGEFDEWQRSQTKRNFGRKLVLSLISLPSPNYWLFAGVHDVMGYTERARRNRPDKSIYVYTTSRRGSTDALLGRAVVYFKRPGRNSYPNADKWSHLLAVSHIREDRLRVVEFPGYMQTLLSKQHLDIIVKDQTPSWKSALSSVAGVYVITDTKTGKLYIGSAVGEHGIWGRWSQYSKTGHGGNRELKQLLTEQGPEHADCFQFGVLETADTRATENDVLLRESHWKRLLLTRDHGYNAN